MCNDYIKATKVDPEQSLFCCEIDERYAAKLRLAVYDLS